jgi:Flp pilus assembly protein TadD
MKQLSDNQKLKIRPEFLICLFLVVTTLAVYFQVRNYDFIDYDDEIYVTNNTHVKAGLTWESIKWAFTTFHGANWHPLTWLSHIADVELYSMIPGQHHISNVLFHIMNTLLLFFVLKRMTGGLWQSAFVAALFALHPLHVESVAQVAERKDVLSTFFWFLVMGAYIRYTERPSIKSYLPVLIFFILGLMAKPMLVTLPCVLLLLDFWPLGRLKIEGFNMKDFRIVLFEKIPLLTLSAASSVVTFFAQQSGKAVQSLNAYPIDVRIENALVSYASYLWKMIYPSGLAFMYPHPLAFPVWKIILSCLLLAMLSFLAIKNIKQRPCLCVGWLWYLGTLVPVIGLVQVGLQAMADRYTYIPLIGIFIMIAYGISDILKTYPHKKVFLVASSAVIFPVLMVISRMQVQYWQDSVTLFERALEKTEGNYMTHNNLGVVFQQQGRIDAAIRHFSKALQNTPNYAIAHNNLGNALEEKGKTDEAIQHYREALRLDPNLLKVYVNLGIALESQGKRDEALRYYAEALRLKPNYVDAHISMGAVLIHKRDFAGGAAHLRKALELSPENTQAHNNLGVALAWQGKIGEAISHFRKVLQIKPDDVTALENLKKLSAIHSGVLK